jgi:long-subunit acyl-CoA synthetase (AMP-forming)
MAVSYREAIAQMTGPGAPFEIVLEEVRGLSMKNWKHREKSLREKVANAALHGDADLLVQGDRRISYGEFARLVWGAARALERDHGFHRGDRLAVLAYNSADWLVALFGAVCMGGVGVGLNGWWGSEEIEHGLNDSGSRVLVVDERLYPRVAPLLAGGRLQSLEKIFTIGEATPRGALPIGELIQPCEQMPDGPIDEDDPFVILYTSGTTGRPKGCITTHRGTIAQVTGIMASPACSPAPVRRRRAAARPRPWSPRRSST